MQHDDRRRVLLLGRQHDGAAVAVPRPDHQFLCEARCAHARGQHEQSCGADAPAHQAFPLRPMGDLSGRCCDSFDGFPASTYGGKKQPRSTQMPLLLEGSCRCGAVQFTVASHTPYPYQLCYCSICRKTAGGGGFAINIMGDVRSLKAKGRRATGIYRAEIAGKGGRCETSTGERNFCRKCATALWLYDPEW